MTSSWPPLLLRRRSRTQQDHDGVFLMLHRNSSNLTKGTKLLCRVSLHVYILSPYFYNNNNNNQKKAGLFNSSHLHDRASQRLKRKRKGGKRKEKADTVQTQQRRFGLALGVKCPLSPVSNPSTPLTFV